MLPRFSRVAKDEPPLEFIEIAAERFAPFAAGCEHNRGGSAKGGRVMVLRPCRHADHDGFNVAADVDPIFAAQARSGQPVQGGADGHGQCGRAANSRPGGRFGIRGQREPARRAEKSHEMRKQRQLIARRTAQRVERGERLLARNVA